MHNVQKKLYLPAVQKSICCLEPCASVTFTMWGINPVNGSLKSFGTNFMEYAYIYMVFHHSSKGEQLSSLPVCFSSECSPSKSESSLKGKKSSAPDRRGNRDNYWIISHIFQ